MSTVGSGAGSNFAYVQGQKKQTDIQSGRRVPQYTGIVDISANVAPLMALMEKQGKNRKVGGPTFFWLEKDKQARFCTISNGGGYASGATSFAVSSGHGARVRIGDLLFVERTQEMIYVSNRSSDTLTVTRGAASTTAAAINDAEELRILSNTHSDGATAPNGVEQEPGSRTNYTQIFKGAIELSGRNMEQAVYGEDEWAQSEKMALETLERDSEQHYLFSNGVASSEPFITGGVQYWVTTNVTNAAGALDEGSWNAWLRGWLRRNVGLEKSCFLFVGELVQAALSGFGRDALRYGPDDATLGITCGAYRAENGMVIKIIPHGMLTAAYSATTAANRGWQGYAFGLNVSQIGEVTFRSTKRQKNIETPGTDGKKDGLIKDAGVQVMGQEQHAIYYGVTG